MELENPPERPALQDEPEGATHPTALSCLYECTVMHQRLEPIRNGFTYKIFMLAVDLDELETLDREVFGFSYNRRNLYSLNDRDHLTLPGYEHLSIRENLSAWLAQQNVFLPIDARIQLITLPRVLGYIFNPVSFYYCYDSEGTPLYAVAEVGNTFRELKPYLLRGPVAEESFRLVTPKHFYVSPFSALDLSFSFKLRVPREELEVHIDDYDGDRRTLLSALTGRRSELTSAKLWWFTLKYPLITLKIIALIHWHAFLLWMKRTPFHRKAANPDLQCEVFQRDAALTPPLP